MAIIDPTMQAQLRAAGYTLESLTDITEALETPSGDPNARNMHAGVVERRGKFSAVLVLNADDYGLAANAMTMAMSGFLERMRAQAEVAQPPRTVN